MKSAPVTTVYRGDDRALIGIVLGVLTFWLFAQSTLNIGPDMAADLGMADAEMNMAIVAAALFCGTFIVAAGGISDVFGRVRVMMVGNGLNILGSLLLAVATGPFAAEMVMFGRVLQGLAAAAIMSASLALIKTYWSGAGRQRAVSIWSIGSWGGTGFCALFAGIVAASPFGWRGIFILCALVSVIGILLTRRIPESRPAHQVGMRLDWIGIIVLALSVVALELFITQGETLGWGNWITWSLLAASAVFLALFFRVELFATWPVLDFKLFRNRAFTGATVVNFLMSATGGVVAVVMWIQQLGWGVSATVSGLTSIGFAIFVIIFIRVGEKLMQRKGARWVISIAGVLVATSVALMMVTNVSQGVYVAISLLGFSLYGIGLGLFATPVTDTALSTLPEDRAGAGAGVFKMSSSLGAALGIGISTAVFTALRDGVDPNGAAATAGAVALGINVVFAVLSLLAAVALIPAGAGRIITDGVVTTATPEDIGGPSASTAVPVSVTGIAGTRTVDHFTVS